MESKKAFEKVSCALVLPLSALAMSACTLIPDYDNPGQSIAKPILESADFVHSKDLWKSATPKDALPKGEWWSVFKDPKLDELIKLCDKSNPDLAAAFYRVERAREAAFMTESDLYPHLSSFDWYKRDGRSEVEAPVSTGTYTTWFVGLGATWDLDLFGRIQSLVIQDRALAQATYDMYCNAMLALHARVAQEYFTLRQYESELVLLNKTLQVRKEQSKFVQKRKRLNFASGADLARALLQESEAASELRSVERKRCESLNRLAVLVGQSPTTFKFECKPLSETLPTVPKAVPSMLLERRPDIAAAERTVFAANARIGSDTAAFFPTVSITADAGFGANKIQDLMTASSFAWGISPQVYIPIFQAGKLYAQRETDLAAYKETVENYRSAVLKAIEEVETALSNIAHMRREYAERVKTTQFAIEVQNYTQTEYELGNQDYFAVSDAQRQALMHEREKIRLLGARFRECVSLVMALGGGWTHASQPDESEISKGIYESINERMQQ